MRLRDQVEAILKMYPATRDDDRKLTVKVWRRWYDQYINQDYGDNVMLEDILRLPNQESIGRHRRKFQEQGLYMASESIQKKRKAHSKTWKKELGYRQPEHAVFDNQAKRHLDEIMQEPMKQIDQIIQKLF